MIKIGKLPAQNFDSKNCEKCELFQIYLHDYKILVSISLAVGLHCPIGIAIRKIFYLYKRAQPICSS